ncbi:hypothetical protein [Sphingomonas crocodyli]|uniref:Uncharacterized protein n=1 Tax=Sphingomonas crocodyli TaxID=1979270 RepID=A0A437M825_9SPHN|nr:hypothetical protein [Sphingomonas crocodyli]RVT93716.1 hypothetical protein EOD43_07575 [Sphingomonas crocodyli]
MNVFAVTLPMPPALSALTNNVPKRGRVKSKPYKAWQEGASAVLRAAWRAQGSPKFEPHLIVTYHLGLNYTGDIANREKALTDLLVQTIPNFPDDRWIDRMEIERVPGIDGARVLVQQAAKPTGEARPIGEIIKPIVADIISKMEDAA